MPLGVEILGVGTLGSPPTEQNHSKMYELPQQVHSNLGCALEVSKSNTVQMPMGVEILGVRTLGFPPTEENHFKMYELPQKVHSNLTRAVEVSMSNTLQVPLGVGNPGGHPAPNF